MLTQERLKELLEYNPETGIFIWKVSLNRHIKIGTRVGHLNQNGRRYIKFNKQRYFAHRLVWFYVYGEWPEHEIDHRDGNPDNNRLDNLRLANRSENQQNIKKYINNSSGYIGVSLNKDKKTWRARIAINKKEIHIGTFVNPLDAFEAYLSAKKKLHTFNPIPREQEISQCEHF